VDAEEALNKDVNFIAKSNSKAVAYTYLLRWSCVYLLLCAIERVMLIRIVLIVLVCISCSSKESISSLTPVSISEYNNRIVIGQQRKEPWSETPLTIINELFPPTYLGERGTDYFVKIQDIQGSIVATVTEEKLLDDSVEGEKRIVTFVKDHDRWLIKTIFIGYKCQKSRGHQNYSGESCS
jgi:hypothetical protein